MAGSGKREPMNGVAEDGADAAEQVAAAASGLADDGATTEREVISIEEAVTEVRAADPLAIPPLLTEVEADAVVEPEAPQEAPVDRGGAVRDKAAEHASAVRDKAAEHAGVARERAAEHAAVAREKIAESAGEAKERLAGGAAEAKVRGAKMRKRFAEAAADARDSASTAASEARGRMANADVGEFAHSTTRLIDQARPFFLAGFAAAFAVLGFLEGDSGTAELFVAGSILFVIGAGFSSEINAFVTARLHRSEDPRHDRLVARPGAHDDEDDER